MLNQNIISMLPGPEVIGEPYWFLMEWKHNKLTGNFFSQKAFCFFLRSQDAEASKKQLPAPHEWVVRGVSKKLFEFIIKQHNHEYKDIIPLVLVPPFSGGKKVLTLKMTADELKYYANHGRLVDKGLQKTLDYAFKIVANPPPDMYTRRLSVDPFLDFLKNNYQRYPRPYPQLPDIIKEYRHSIWADAEYVKDEAKEIIKNITPQDQCYTQTFELHEKSNYDITWSIPNLKKAVSTYNLQPTTLSLDTLAPIVDQSNIVSSHLNKALGNEDPILVVRYPMVLPNLCIVDGNHRVIAKHNAGQTTIQVYLFEPQHHLEAMNYSVHRTLFKVHYNLNEIVKYMSCLNPAEKIELLPLK